MFLKVRSTDTHVCTSELTSLLPKWGDEHSNLVFSRRVLAYIYIYIKYIIIYAYLYMYMYIYIMYILTVPCNICVYTYYLPSKVDVHI